MNGAKWRKSPPELVERFHEAVGGVQGLEVRRMFGSPAGFVGGNMAAGVHQEAFFVRLSADDRRTCTDEGWAPFEPMLGRPLREYLVLPDEVVADPDASRAWVERSAEYVRTLPAKQRKQPKPKVRRA